MDVFKNVVTDICLSNSEICMSLLPEQMSQEFSSVINIPIMKSGQLNTILYHFELHIYENCTSTTENEECYVNQCAFLIKNRSDVYEGDKVKINTMFNNGHLFLSIDNN